eukprot:6212158-Pleurochrysis_carterae.AAC.2
MLFSSPALEASLTLTRFHLLLSLLHRPWPMALVSRARALAQQLEQRAPRSARGKPSLPPEPAPEQEIAQLPQPTTFLGTIFENQADMNAEPCAIASADTAERAASTRSARQLKRAVLPASTDFSPAKNSGSAERVSRELINLLSD